MKRILLNIIRCYREFVSPLFPPRCRFHPSCSEYAFIAIQRFGVIKGTILSAGRLVKCQPYHKGGCDPVPNE